MSSHPQAPATIFAASDFPSGSVHLPSLLITQKGTLITICQLRKEGVGDWGGDVDLLSRRSLDSGKTWEPVRTLFSEIGQNCINGPVVEDKETGTLILTFTKIPSSGTTQAQWVGYFAERGGSLWTMMSHDDGLTWSTPIETKPHGKEGWIGWPNNSSHGLQLPGGRLVIGGLAHRHFDGASHHYHELELNSCLLLSDDHGKSWQIGAIAPYFTDELAVTTCSDGSLLSSVRFNNRKPNDLVRLLARSRDAGETFGEIKLQDHLSLCDCHVGFTSMRDTSLGYERHILLHTGPQGGGTPRVHWGDRTCLSIRLSYDNGEIWPVSRILSEPQRNIEYSDLAVASNGTIFCLYGVDTFIPRASRIELIQFSLSSVELGYGPHI